MPTPTDLILRELDNMHKSQAERDRTLDARLQAMQAQSSQEHAEMAERVAALEQFDHTVEVQQQQLRAWAKCAAGLIASSAALGAVLTTLVGLVR